MSPKISIIISAYNHEKFVAKAIQSVLNQTFQDFELLIIDDNSTDKTAEIIQRFDDKRIEFFKNNKNLGMVINTNNMIKIAKGEYIAIINSDDYWEVEKLAKQIDFLEKNPHCGACFTMANAVDEKDKIINNPKINPFKYRDLTREQLLNYFFFNDNFICYPSVLMRKKAIEDINFFNPSYVILLDIDAWIRILIKGYDIKILPDILTNFRIMDNEANLSGNNIRTRTICHAESKRLLMNYININGYEDFVKIFPDYSEIALNNKNLPVYFYLLDYSFKKIFANQNYNSYKNIKNFIIEFIYEKSYAEPSFFKILYDENILDYKRYLSIIAHYPSGLKLLKYQKNVRLFRSLLVLITSIFFCFVAFGLVVFL